MSNPKLHLFPKVVILLIIFAAVMLSAQEPKITLPSGFKATIFADNLGRARHITINKNGDVYVMLREPHEGSGVVALRDNDMDGRADEIDYFCGMWGTGIEIYQNYLYVAPDTAVYRYELSGDQLVPEGPPEAIVTGLQTQRQHASKPIAFDENGHLYVNIGAPSNACQEQLRTPGSPGQDPCPQLGKHGGIWQFSAVKKNQRLSDAKRYCTGIRHCVAIAMNPVVDQLYAVMHGRDQLNSLWSEHFTVEDNAKLPAEEFLLIREGSNFGWPYCYYDGFKDQLVLAPEYGGDGDKVGRCEQYDDPIMDFPAHWAPNDLIFYTASMFPKKYKNGAFIAFHGSWNRAPKPQQGYKVVFVPFDGEMPSGDYKVFANNFAQTDVIVSTRDAKYRPMGLAQAPDGSLFITDSQRGRIWNVRYE